MRAGSSRIALLDNTINTSYVFAKLLRRAGYEADFIQQPDMPFNHQPVWEDVDVAEPAGTVLARVPSDRHWRELERRLGWARPAWVIRPRWRATDVAMLPGVIARLAAAVPPYLIPPALALSARTVPLVRTLREYDLVLVVGPSAATAYLSRPPYAVITMGWDIFTLPFMTGSRNPIRRARAHLQRRALATSQAILSLPSMDLDAIRQLGLVDRMRPFPVPVDVDGYGAIATGSRASIFGEELAQRMEGKLVFFCPSRISFAEKGQDILLRAFAEVRARIPALLILLGWGHEIDRATSLIRELRLDDDVHVLPFVLSKHRLIRALRATDVATVQFVLGGYGGVARDALAAGVPVISSYDPAAPQPHPADDPAPILSADTVETVRDAMLRLSDPSLRADFGARGVEWARRCHQQAPLAEVDRLLAGLS